MTDKLIVGGIHIVQHSMVRIEEVVGKGETLAWIVRAQVNPEETSFVTPPTTPLQLGHVVYPSGGEVVRHRHRPLERHVVGTAEVLIVKKGRCSVDIYDGSCELVATRELRAGDIILFVAGGHGFRMLEDTVLLEIKQGPYGGPEEKERF